MIIKQLIGQRVKVSFRESGSIDMHPGGMQGTLMECDEIFVCIDPGNDKSNVFVPLTAIHHIEFVREK